jgi:TonB family protein
MASSLHDRLETPVRRMGVGAGLALALHAAALSALAALAAHAPRRPPEPPEPEEAVEVTAIEVPEPPPEAPPTGQAVENVGDTPEEPPAEDTPYIANRDSNPAREARRRTPSPEPQRPPPGRGPRSTPAPPKPATVAHAGGQVIERAPEAEQKPADTAAVPGAPAAETTTPAPAPTQAAPVPAPGTEREGPAITIGMSQDVDKALRDLPVGDDPALRARRSALASYVNVLRAHVRQRWKLPDLGGRYAEKKLVTVLGVRVKADGNLERVEVRSRSGVQTWDDEAAAVIERSRPFPAPPPEVLDVGKGLSIRWEWDSFELDRDLGIARFQKEVGRILREEWRPSPAFRMSGDRERVTVVRAVFTVDGMLADVAVWSPSGIGFLDHGVIAAMKVGSRFPTPPAAFADQVGLVPVWIEFHHRVGRESGLRILRPGEAAPLK